MTKPAKPSLKDYNGYILCPRTKKKIPTGMLANSTVLAGAYEHPLKITEILCPHCDEPTYHSVTKENHRWELKK